MGWREEQIVFTDHVSDAPVTGTRLKEYPISWYKNKLVAAITQDCREWPVPAGHAGKIPRPIKRIRGLSKYHYRNCRPGNRVRVTPQASFGVPGFRGQDGW